MPKKLKMHAVLKNDHRPLRFKTKKEVVPTSIPLLVPEILVDVFFLHFLQNLNTSAFTDGYTTKDVIVTLALLKRVDRAFLKLVNEGLKRWQRQQNMDEYGFSLRKFPIRTLYDICACTQKMCFCCGKQMTGLSESARYDPLPYLIKNVDDSFYLGELLVNHCQSCETSRCGMKDSIVESTGLHKLNMPIPLFFRNTTKQHGAHRLMAIEKYSGVADWVMLKRNKFVKKLNQERKLKLKTEQWLNGIVADAKRDDVIRLLKDKFDLEYDLPLTVAKYEWGESLTFQMDNQGVVNERWLKAEAGKIATKWFFGASPLPAHATWQSRNLFDRYVRIMASMPMEEIKEHIGFMRIASRKPMPFHVVGVSFMKKRGAFKKGYLALYKHCLETTNVCIELHGPNVNLPWFQSKSLTRKKIGSVRVVVEGNVFYNLGLPDSDMKFLMKDLFEEANANTHMLAKELDDLDESERVYFNGAIRKHFDFHEKRCAALLHNQLIKSRDGITLQRYGDVLSHIRDEELFTLDRILGPSTDDLPPQKKGTMLPHHNCGYRVFEYQLKF